MSRVKLYVGIITLCILGLLLTSCAGESVSQVEDAADARDAAITYLQESECQNAPNTGIEWQGEDITPSGLVGAVTTQFTSDEWTITVSYPIVPPEDTAYTVVVSSIKLGWHWKGKVDFSGNIIELSAFKRMSKEESQRIAEEFVRSCPTFVYDGIEDTLV